jgi:hypothetical protein
MGDSVDKKKIAEVGKVIKECVEYDINTRNESLLDAPQFIHDFFTTKKFPKDHPDQLYVDVLFNLTLWIIVGGGLVAAGILPGPVYLMIKFVVFLGRFMLLLHYSAHVVTSPALTWWAAWIISPFFGLPADTYRYHHLYMHHAENNQIPWDLTTTMPYQRDNLLHFLMYWARHAFGTYFELPYRTAMRRSFADAAVLSGKVLAHFVGTYYAYQYFPHATLWVIIMPFILSTGALMFGNFSQHIFVDAKDFDNNMLLTYNCIGEHSNNRNYFNDGYHIVHHANSKLHWTDTAKEFGDNW